MMYSSGKDFESGEKHVKADGVKGFAEVYEHQEAGLVLALGMLEDIIAGSGHLSYISSIDVCLLLGVDDSLQGGLHSGGDTSRHHLEESVQEGDRVEVGVDGLVLVGLRYQHNASFPLPIKYGPGSQNVIDSIWIDVQDHFKDIWVGTSSYSRDSWSF